MTALKRRDRIVIFRLTQDEYDNLKSVCLRRGARTLSDFARSELLLALQRERSEVMQELSDLRSMLERLERLLASSLEKAESGKEGKA